MCLVRFYVLKYVLGAENLQAQPRRSDVKL
jgi:hypothetical protein